MSIIVLQHDANNRPGRLGATFRDHGLDLDVRKLHEGDAVPSDLDNVRGVISLGGKPNVDEGHAWIQPELELLRAAHEAELPVVGVCLGHQMIAKALGGEVGKMDEPEIGFKPVDIAVPGQTDIMLAGVPWRSSLLHIHSYEVKAPPPGAIVLASSEATKVQIFRAGLRTFGFQFHMEADMGIIRDIARAIDGQVLQQFESEAEEHYDRFALIGNRLSVNLVSFCFPFSSLTAV
ncbi:MAG: type 1 glutamine amidotransferase [Planctomycetota bacterium]